MPEPIDEGLVARVTQSEYFRYLVDQEVAKRTEEKLKSWWKRIVAITAVVVSVLGFVGARELVSLHTARLRVESIEREINSKVVDLDQQMEKLQAMLGEAGITLNKAQALSDVAGATLRGSQGMNKEGLRLVGSASAVLAESRLAIQKGITDQQKIARSAEESLRELKVLQASLDGELERIESKRRAIEEIGNKIEKQAKEAGDLRELRADLEHAKLDLEKAKTFTYFILKHGETRDVEIGGSRLSFSVQKIAQPFELSVYTTGGTGDIHTQEEKNLRQGRKFKLAGTRNLYCEVVATRYRGVGPDFALLKVFAR